MNTTKLQKQIQTLTDSNNSVAQINIIHEIRKTLNALEDKAVIHAITKDGYNFRSLSAVTHYPQATLRYRYRSVVSTGYERR